MTRQKRWHAFCVRGARMVNLMKTKMVLVVGLAVVAVACSGSVEPGSSTSTPPGESKAPPATGGTGATPAPAPGKAPGSTGTGPSGGSQNPAGEPCSSTPACAAGDTLTSTCPANADCLSMCSSTDPLCYIQMLCGASITCRHEGAACELPACEATETQYATCEKAPRACRVATACGVTIACVSKR